MTIPPLTNVDVLVCQTFRRADMPDQAVRNDAQLLTKLDNADLSAGVRVHGVDCLSNFKNGCTIVLQAAARWTYIYENIKPVSDFDQLCEGIASYSDNKMALCCGDSEWHCPGKTASPVFRLRPKQTDRQRKTAQIEQY